MAASFDPATLQSYIVYSALLALKLQLMSLQTSKVRYTKRVFANPEDRLKGSVVKYDDPDVERVRRAHLNDLENIPVFWVLGALYVTTGPPAGWAAMLFRTYTAARVVHTLVYAVKPMPQPSRGIAYTVGLMVNLYMGAKVVMHYLNAL